MEGLPGPREAPPPPPPPPPPHATAPPPRIEVEVLPDAEESAEPLLRPPSRDEPDPVPHRARHASGLDDAIADAHDATADGVGAEEPSADCVVSASAKPYEREHLAA